MDRTERLFALLDALRRNRRPTTATVLAADLGVSVRTIYRDVQALIGLGAGVEGEAGVGYVLRPGFFLPPLIFDENELEALVLGARWVQQQGDVELRDAAATAMAKIGSAGPEDLRDAIADSGLWAPTPAPEVSVVPALRPLREAIRREHKLRILYRDQNAACSERMIWPIALGFYEGAQLVAAWCELRQDFRHFRADRITVLSATGERYPARRTTLVRAWRRENGIPAPGS